MKPQGILFNYKINRLSSVVILFLLLSFPSYSTAWYVNKNANGSNNGTSWTNAWKLFSSINWNLIQPGDYLYISGGTDSLVYDETLLPACSGTASNYITIIVGKYSPYPAGHSGRVIIDGGGMRYGIGLYDQGGNKPSYIRIKGFETKNVVSGVYANMNVLHKCLVLDSLQVYGFSSPGIKFEVGETGFQNVDSLFIQNCKIVSPNYIDGESDGIQLKGVSHVFIDRNYIRIPNQQPTAHVDALQGYLCNGGIITNNILISDSVYSPEGGGMPIIYGAEGTLPVIIYNNFCYMGGAWYTQANMGGALMTRWYNHNPMPPTYIIHNTIISNGPRVRGLWLEFATPTSTIVVNNIIAQYSTTTSGVISTFDNSTNSVLQVNNIRHNLFYRSWSNDVTFSGSVTGNGRTGTPTGWNDFVNNYGGTGVKGNPLLIRNIGHEPDQGILNGEIQSGSPAINQGEDIEWMINYLNTTYELNGRLTWTDIKGNIRDNTPDIGAYQYQIISNNTFSVSVSVRNDWNMVSVPGLHPSNQNVGTWWAHSVGIVWGLNGVQYVPKTTATPGEGYWMINTLAETYNYSAIQIVPHNPIPVALGWNMIGGYETSPTITALKAVNPQITGTVWGFNGVNYVAATNLVPGYSYWVEVTSAGTITIPDVVSKDIEEVEEKYNKEDWGRIMLTDAAGITFTLYAVKGEVDLDQYKLPPIPPEGIFDIRYESGRIAENLENGEQFIEMRGISYPVRLHIENMDIILEDEYGEYHNTTLKNGEEIIIHNKAIDKLKIVSGLILNPIEYSLKQNFPNPFNPKTLIEFSIPEETNVNLKIYNLLGEKITELVNEKLEAGNHSYTWNAQNNASGVYIYELNTDKYSAYKKMILLR